MLMRPVVRIVATMVLMPFGVFGWELPALNQEAQPAAAGLKIVVLAGEDGVNIIKKKTAVKPVVEVRDKNDLPVAGAYVTFLAPNMGPGATFLHGAKSFSILTNASGKAIVPAMKPIGTGAFKISVSASFQGQTATAAISQANYMTAAAAQAAGAGAGGAAGSGTGGAAGAAGAGGAAAGGMSTGLIVGIVAGVAAAGAVIGKVASGGGNNGGNTPAAPHGTIGSGGPPTVGPPH